MASGPTSVASTTANGTKKVTASPPEAAKLTTHPGKTTTRIVTSTVWPVWEARNAAPPIASAIESARSESTVSGTETGLPTSVTTPGGGTGNTSGPMRTTWVERARPPNRYVHAEACPAASTGAEATPSSVAEAPTTASAAASTIPSPAVRRGGGASARSIPVAETTGSGVPSRSGSYTPYPGATAPSGRRKTRTV